jgi:5,10-methylene-tetrahydrofolate dehydrogenase/methenyl tetrahydrofolate cyclohydrolase
LQKKIKMMRRFIHTVAQHHQLQRITTNTKSFTSIARSTANRSFSSNIQHLASNIIDGKKHANVIHEDIRAELHQIQQQQDTNKKPGLAVILVGDRKDSVAYVRMKRKAAENLGFFSLESNLPVTISQRELIEQIHQYNTDDRIHGILIQLPLPSHIHEETVLSEIFLTKDVDGFHPINMGSLAMKNREPHFVPCTPKGCIELLDREGVNLDGAHVVVIGRSNIVGLPTSLCLLNRNATVTICHTHSSHIEKYLPLADIIISACGVPGIVKKEYVKPGVVVLDVGINPVDDPSKKSGYKLVGDVDFDNVKEVAYKITPVPGGIGPMTIAMLMQNTFVSFKRFLGL